jgi:hypothetical protein
MPCPICNQKPANCDCTETERWLFAEIEELTAEVERLRDQVPRWIPVSDRLPNGYDPAVLVTDGEWVTMACWDSSDEEWLVIEAAEAYGRRPRDRFTYWQPMPAPPEVE